MKGNGGLRDLNRAFKASRKVDRSIRYHDFLHAYGWAERAWGDRLRKLFIED